MSETRDTHKVTGEDEFLRDFLAKVPHDLARTFSDDQLAAMRAAFAPAARRRHPVDLRLSIPFFGKRFFVVLMAGPEQRSRGRRRIERTLHPVSTAGNMVSLVVISAFAFLPISVLLAALGDFFDLGFVPDFTFGIWDALEEQLRFMFR